MSDRQDNVIQFKRRRTGAVVGGIAGVLVVSLILLFTCFKIDTIEVTGNKHYSKDQIKDYVLSEGYINNTVLLMLKNKIRPIEDIPFVAKLDMNMSVHIRLRLLYMRKH